MSVSIAISVPAVVVALQVYCPPWDVRTGVNCSALVRTKVETSLITIAILLSILISTGASHCTVRSSVSGPPSARVTEQVREKGSPVASVPVEEIVTLGRGATIRDKIYNSSSPITARVDRLNLYINCSSNSHESLVQGITTITPHNIYGGRDYHTA